MKKIAAICLCVIMAVSMVACGSSSSSDDTKNTSSKSSASSSSADSKSGDSKGGDSSGQDLSKYKFNKGELVRMTDDKNEPALRTLISRDLSLWETGLKEQDLIPRKTADTKQAD